MTNTALFALLKLRLKSKYGKKVVEAMKKVPRHLFVPEKLQSKAYENRPLSIGYGATISQPTLVGFMTELLKPSQTDVVLEVGTGSGYQSAVLSKLVKKVYSIEVVPALGKSAKKRLKQLQYLNVITKIGNGYLGWEKYAPFDKIILTAAPPFIPPKLLSQLKRGGRIVIPVGAGESQTLMVLKKSITSDKIVGRNIIPVRFVPMV